MLRTPFVLASASLVFSCLLAVPCLAEKNVTLEPKLAKVASPAVVETFDGKFGKPFAKAKGEWEIADGALVGKELAADKHAAVLSYNKPNQDSIVRFSFKLQDKTNGLHFSMNRKGGHLFRVIVTPAQLAISLDKDKKDPKSKPLSLGKAKAKFDKGTWYTMQVEMVGDKVVVQTDNGITLDAQNEKLAVKKPNYRFVMRKEALLIDDLHIWDVK